MESVTGAGVVVTGGGSGIGAALARRFVAEGARVVINDVNGEAAEAVAGSCDQSGGGKAVAVAGDAASEEGVAGKRSRKLRASSCWDTGADMYSGRPR